MENYGQSAKLDRKASHGLILGDYKGMIGEPFSDQ
jgi:hypothetical protein